jgi:hypothetical protein
MGFFIVTPACAEFRIEALRLDEAGDEVDHLAWRCEDAAATWVGEACGRFITVDIEGRPVAIELRVGHNDGWIVLNARHDKLSATGAASAWRGRGGVARYRLELFEANGSLGLSMCTGRCDDELNEPTRRALSNRRSSLRQLGEVYVVIQRRDH